MAKLSFGGRPATFHAFIRRHVENFIEYFTYPCSLLGAEAQPIPLLSLEPFQGFWPEVGSTDYHIEEVTFSRGVWEALGKMAPALRIPSIQKSHHTSPMLQNWLKKKVILFPNKSSLFWADHWISALALWFLTFSLQQGALKVFSLQINRLTKSQVLRLWTLSSHESLKVLRKQAVMWTKHIRSPADFHESI